MNKVLEILKETFDCFEEKSIPTEYLVKMGEFVLKNNYFEFNSNAKHQKSGTPIGTHFTTLYGCIYVDCMETQFLRNE